MMSVLLYKQLGCHYQSAFPASRWIDTLLCLITSMVLLYCRTSTLQSYSKKIKIGLLLRSGPLCGHSKLRQHIVYGIQPPEEILLGKAIVTIVLYVIMSICIVFASISSIILKIGKKMSSLKKLILHKMYEHSL